VTGRRAALAALVVLIAGCVHYPTVEDVGGPRIRTENGRALRQDGSALAYFDVVSTGKFGDVITGVATPVAKTARLVDAAGAPLARFEIPGTATVKLAPGGPHVVITDLLRALTPGETFIVTLLFEKSGGIGVIAVVE
jgi:copper(I)-binding protein